MADTSFDSTQPSSSDSATDESAVVPVKGNKKKPATPLVLHPAQEKAIKYASFMFADTAKEQTAAEILQDALARYLGLMQKKGLEFPPGMLADLRKLNLIS